MKTPPLTESEKNEVQWATSQLDLLARASAVQTLAPIAARLTTLLRRHVEASFPPTAEEEEARRMAEKRLAENGPKLWDELQMYAAKFPDNPSAEQIAEAESWLDRFNERVKKQLCASCGGGMRRFRKGNQVDWTQPRALFRWAWAFHNAVNAAKGKPEYSFEEASRRYL